jgi:SAM-dependent methyltransferase
VIDSAKTAMPPAPVTRTPDGRAYLHIWRTGRSYAQQKEALYRREWTNVLFSVLPQPPDEREVRYHDVRKPLPFADQTFDAVYALHILEHLTPAEAATWTGELFRMLKPGGIVRISTPDLEDICRSYLRQLDACRANPSKLNAVRYRWSVLELLDQLVREQSGGLMSPTVAAGDFDPEFARIRYGDVFDEFTPAAPRLPAARTPLLQRLRVLTPSSLIASLRWRVIDIVDPDHGARLQKLPNEPRRTGELNKWMYDALALEALLENAGFRDHQRQDHRSSMIPNWSRYLFDQSTRGSHPIEPSLYFESRRPAARTDSVQR